MSLDSRRDNRSIEQFSNDIKQAHILEEKIAQALVKQFEADTLKSVKVLKNGVDSEGNLLYNLSNHNVDRIFIIGDEQYPIEIKTAPNTTFFTFKVSSLESCVKENAYIVIYVKASDKYYISSPKFIAKLLKLPHKIYERFSPNDKAVRIFKDQFDKYLEIRTWCDEAQEILNAND